MSLPTRLAHRSRHLRFCSTAATTSPPTRSPCREVAEGRGGDPYEVSLWHGSPQLGNISSIVQEGFDFRLSSQAGALGLGTYFAASASYSDMYRWGAKRNMGALGCGCHRSVLCGPCIIQRTRTGGCWCLIGKGGSLLAVSLVSVSGLQRASLCVHHEAICRAVSIGATFGPCRPLAAGWSFASQHYRVV